MCILYKTRTRNVHRFTPRMERERGRERERESARKWEREIDEICISYPVRDPSSPKMISQLDYLVSSKIQCFIEICCANLKIYFQYLCDNILCKLSFIVSKNNFILDIEYTLLKADYWIGKYFFCTTKFLILR